MVCIGRDLKDHKTPTHVLDQVGQGHIQPGLEHLQGWGIHNFSWQLFPVPHYSYSEELPPNV